MLTRPMIYIRTIANIKIDGVMVIPFRHGCLFGGPVSVYVVAGFSFRGPGLFFNSETQIRLLRIPEVFLFNAWCFSAPGVLY